MLSVPRFLSRHALILHGMNYTLDRFATRFGTVEWFLKTVQPEMAWGGETVAQGDREDVVQILRALARGCSDAELDGLL